MNFIRAPALTKIIFWMIFEDMASKLEKIDPVFQSINFASLKNIATDDREQFQCHK